MLDFFTTAHWKQARQKYLNEARECRDFLMANRGYAKNDPHLTAAVEFWLLRARNAHSFALGRRPVIDNAIVINQGEAVQGSLYAA